MKPSGFSCKKQEVKGKLVYMVAIPVLEPSRTLTPEVSMPSFLSPLIRLLPKSSEPTAPIIFIMISDGEVLLGRESRAVATASERQ